MEKRKKYIIFLFLAVFLLLLFSSSVQALTIKEAFSVDAGTPAGQVRAASGYQVSSPQQIEQIVARVIRAILSFLGIIFTCFIIYGGYLWMSAMGKEQQVTKGKDLITEAVIGLGIVAVAYGISYFAIYYLGPFLK